MSAAALALTGVGFVRDGRPILDGVDWTVRDGQRWVVLGPNGAGKSTLLRLASTYELPTRGRIEVLGRRVGGVDLRQVRPEIGLVSPGLADGIAPGTTARDAVVTGVDATLRRFRQEYTPDQWRRVDELLGLVGCADLADVRFDRLSDGERQRVLLARALVTRPRLLLLDEPGANLDLAGRELLLRALGEVTSEPELDAVCLVTHHVEEIPDAFTHVLLLRDGRTVAAGRIDETLTGPALSACFGLTVRVERRGGRFVATATSDAPIPSN